MVSGRRRERGGFGFLPRTSYASAGVIETPRSHMRGRFGLGWRTSRVDAGCGRQGE
jgi:hypothetical protein